MRTLKSNWTTVLIQSNQITWQKYRKLYEQQRTDLKVQVGGVLEVSIVQVDRTMHG